MSSVESALAPRTKSQRPGLVLASRGDALTPYLFSALQSKFPIVGEIHPELTRRQRYQVAAVTMRPTRTRWIERFYKSAYASRLRSANAARQLRSLDAPPDVVFQVHALFSVAPTSTVMYIDCTHRQSAEFWPAWNPLRGPTLDEWYRRERESYQAAAHLFAFCEPTRTSLINDYGVDPNRVTVTGAGPNLTRLPTIQLGRHRPPDGPPTILLIGNDFVRKGGHVLLEAFRTVRSVIPDARLQLVGSNPMIRAQDGVQVLGRVRDRARVAEFYRGATVFCMPSFFDPYPLALLEAMAFGLPTVATRQMGTPEIVADGHTGYLVEPGRPDDLADALLRVLLNPLAAAEVGAAARRNIEERFTWDSVVSRMSPALQGLSGSAR